jgi:hypothetical protein
MAFKLRRGTEADRQNITPEEGELIYTTDNKQLFVGDGATVGGNPASGGGVVAGLSIPASDPFYADAQAAPNSPFLDGNLHLRGYDIVGTGDINIDGTITATGNIDFGNGGGDVITFNGEIGSDFIPSVDGEYKLGSDPTTDPAGKVWAEVWAGTGYFASIESNGDIITTGAFKGNVIGSGQTTLVDYDNDLIPGDAISGTVTADLVGNVTGNVSGNLTGDVTVDVVYGNDGTTTIIDADVTGNPDGVAVFTGEFQGLLIGDVELAASVTGSDGVTQIIDGVNNKIVAPVEADVTGNLTGNSTGLHTGDVNGDLYGTVYASDNTTVIVDHVNQQIIASGGVNTDGITPTVSGTLQISGGLQTSGDVTIGGALIATGTIAATTAARLATVRTINGVGFDGTANITVEDNSKLPTSGLVPMLGDLTLAQDPTSPLHAVTKQYVDNNFFETSTNTTISAAETTFANTVKVSDIQEETSGNGLSISSVNGNVLINAGSGTVGLQNLAGGTVTVSGIDVAGTNISTGDSSNITVSQITQFLSDVVIDGAVTAAKVDAELIETSGAGVPRLESDTNIEVSIPDGRLNVIDGLINLSAYTLTDLDTDFTGTEGDFAFVEDSTLPQPYVFTANTWLPMMSPTIGWVLGNDGSNTNYTFTGPGFTSATNDPALTLYRGHTYVIDNTGNGTAHPLHIQTSDPTGVGFVVGNEYTTGITGSADATLIWTVPMDAPSTLYYVCENHGTSMFGTITVA